MVTAATIRISAAMARAGLPRATVKTARNTNIVTSAGPRSFSTKKSPSEMPVATSTGTTCSARATRPPGTRSSRRSRESGEMEFGAVARRSAPERHQQAEQPERREQRRVAPARQAAVIEDPPRGQREQEKTDEQK